MNLNKCLVLFRDSYDQIGVSSAQCRVRASQGEGVKYGGQINLADWPSLSDNPMPGQSDMFCAA